MNRNVRTRRARRTITSGAGTTRRRMPALLGAVVVSLVAAATVAATPAVAAPADQVVPSTPSGPTTKQNPVPTVPNTTGVDGVTAYDTSTLQHGHVTGPVKYSVIPPIGGPHNGTWMNAGVYTVPIPAERAVHNLEHGAVWITYRPSLPADQVSTLLKFVQKQSVLPEGHLEPGGPVVGNRYMDMSPWTSDAALGAPIVISSWGYQLQVTSPTDPRLQQFVDTFRRKKGYTPELNSPVDGVKVSIGGRAAYCGANYPNPA